MSAPNFWRHPSADVEEGVMIGSGTKIWHRAHVRVGAQIGSDCVIGKDVFVDHSVSIGDRCKLQNSALVYFGVVIRDDVFVGPGVVFTNDLYPRSFSSNWEVLNTLVETGASIGANSTIVCGVTIGEYSIVGAGSVVTRNVEPYTLVVGNPAKVLGKVDKTGLRIK